MWHEKGQSMNSVELWKRIDKKHQTGQTICFFVEEKDGIFD